MSFLELARKRSSVRKYQSKAVECDKINMILEAGRVSPTAANLQPNHFLVLTDSEDMEKLNKGTNPHGATLAIIICTDKNTSWIRPYDNASMIEVDATIATDHMMMCAEDLGLGSCWLTYFDPTVIRNEFNIPCNLVPVNILAIGYPDGDLASPSRHSTTRKALNDMVHYKSF
ncbi:MAG: nitroreductase family protein [Lachnospiraceae bacterium]|nr:nitroreductase family protein [Lachnospiraceae bacterium]